MTILSPTEQAEVTRFGIHDEDVITDLEERMDETPRCVVSQLGVKCTATATHVLVCRSCGRQCGLVCTPHVEEIIHASGWRGRDKCGAEGPLMDLVKVVPL